MGARALSVSRKAPLDALIDLPFAPADRRRRPGLFEFYVESGWLGRYLVPARLHGSYSRLAIVLVLTFIGLPFIVRTVQPILEDLEAELEEAAASLGATRLQTFWRVILPLLLPAIVTGFALAFARGLGEYGSVVFVSGNMPFKTEIAPVLIVASLEGFNYNQAAAIAVVLPHVAGGARRHHLLERWSKRWQLTSRSRHAPRRQARTGNPAAVRWLLTRPPRW